MTTTSASSSLRIAQIIPRFRDWRMGRKLLLAFVALATLPLAVAGVVSINASRQALLSQGSINLLSYSRNTASQIDQYLAAHRDDIVMVSQLPEVASVIASPNDQVVRTRALRTLTAAAGKQDYEAVSIANTAGEIIFSSFERDLRVDISSDKDFVEAMRGTVYVSDPVVSLSTGRPGIYFSAPVLDATGQIVGVARSRLSLDGIWAMVEGDTDKAGPGTVGMLVDENGIRLAHSLSRGNRDAIVNTLLYRAVAPLSPEEAKRIVDEKRFGAATTQTVEVVPLPEVARSLATIEDQTFETLADNSTARHYAGAVQLSIKPWRYIVMTPVTTFTRLADDLNSIFVVIAVIVVALASVLSIWAARVVTAPILHLTKVADRISLGDLSAKIEIDQKDEIGELAEAVRRMQTSLQGAINRLRARRTPAP